MYAPVVTNLEGMVLCLETYLFAPSFEVELNPITIYFSDAALDHIKVLMERFRESFREKPVLNLIVRDDVVIIGFVPPEVNLPENDCYRICDIPIYIEHPLRTEERLRTKYIDEMNDIFFIRARGPGGGVATEVSLRPFNELKF